MKIALLGGSFNPVHTGHIALGRTVAEHMGYDRVVYIPAYCSPFKAGNDGATDADRLAMLHAALDPFPWAQIETCELERGGLSYTYDTVVDIIARYTEQGILEGKPGLIVGSDISERFGEWYRVTELVQLVDLLVARRPCVEADADGVARSFPFPHISVVNELFDISSSQIRSRCSRGEACDSLVPPAVLRYISDRGLYGQEY